MVKQILRLAALGVLLSGLAGCVSFGDDEVAYNDLPREPGRNVTQDNGQKPLQCVPFARDHSQVKIYGDAYTWWDQAAGKFDRDTRPAAGAVMVLTGYAGPDRGHVAVVQKIISPREIRVDHANWLDDGSIFLNDPVVDVSADNDWSDVRVWNIQSGAWGGHVYPVQGFILPKTSMPLLARNTAPTTAVFDKSLMPAVARPGPSARTLTPIVAKASPPVSSAPPAPAKDFPADSGADDENWVDSVEVAPKTR